YNLCMSLPDALPRRVNGLVAAINVEAYEESSFQIEKLLWVVWRELINVLHGLADIGQTILNPLSAGCAVPQPKDGHEKQIKDKGSINGETSQPELVIKASGHHEADEVQKNDRENGLIAKVAVFEIRERHSMFSLRRIFVSCRNAPSQAKAVAIM